jgi:hypothetical protein
LTPKTPNSRQKNETRRFSQNPCSSVYIRGYRKKSRVRSAKLKKATVKTARNYRNL